MKALPVLALLVLLAACSDQGTAEPESADTPYRPLKTQTDALDQARALEDQIQQGFEQRDRQMQEQGG